jgi:hypothetical protein
MMTKYTKLKKIHNFVKKLNKENDKRIADYKKNGGGEHLYHDGKSQAYLEIMEAISLEVTK